MFSDKMKAQLVGMALASAVFAVPSVASAGVVVKSSGPSAGTYPVGRQVADSATITLRSGDRITVLTDSGTRVMSGPGTFRVGEGAARTNNRFSRLTRRGAARQVRTGAVRGAGDAAVARSPNLWFVNVAASGNMCLYDLDAVRLWRPEAEAAQTYSIVDSAAETALDVTFVGTETMRALDPAVITLSPGTEYTILAPAPAGAESEERATVNVTFKTLPGENLGPDELALALIENGCMSQLSLLADTLEGG